MAVVTKAGIVLVGGDQCVHLVRTEDVENQDKICNKQERAQENSAVQKVKKVIVNVRIHDLSFLRVRSPSPFPASCFTWESVVTG